MYPSLHDYLSLVGAAAAMPDANPLDQALLL